MEYIKLAPRLAAAAGFISEGARVADVGTDHGYLPVWLAQSGRAAFIAASDIKSAPLGRAVLSARKYGVADKIDFRLGNGLECFEAGEIDTAVIAGMGGETIAAIIEAAPWCRDCTLILQPMSRREKLGEYLQARNMKICAERLVKENGEIYPVLCVKPECQESLDCEQTYLSRRAFEDKEELLPEYLVALLARLERAAAGAESSKRREDAERAGRLRAAADELERLRREYGI